MLKSLLILLVILAVCYAPPTPTPGPPDPCNQWTNCDECLQDSPENCGWCACTQTCWTGSMGGPSVGVCDDWVSPGQFGICPQCSDNSNCIECRAAANCGWCDNTMSCVALGSTACAPSIVCPAGDYDQCTDCLAGGYAWCPSSLTCLEPSTASCSVKLATTNCTCALYQDCNSCNTQESCGWCEKGTYKNTCVGIGSSCMLTHSGECPVATHRAFDAPSFVGGMFLVIGIVIIGAGVYYGYRYFSRGQGYETVQ